jgi:hypothetical protein
MRQCKFPGCEKQAWHNSDMCERPHTERDPRDPDPTREGIFRYHNCWKCHDGELPCVSGNSNSCEFPHARND